MTGILETIFIGMLIWTIVSLLILGCIDDGDDELSTAQVVLLCSSFCIILVLFLLAYDFVIWCKEYPDKKKKQKAKRDKDIQVYIKTKRGLN